MNRIRIIPASALTTDLLVQWRAMAEHERYLNSPFFRPEYTQAVAAVRSDVEVALIEKEGELAGVFPFQRAAGGLAGNVGGRLSEFHAPMMRHMEQFDAAAVLKTAGLRRWYFDHLPMMETPPWSYLWGTSSSPYIDLSNGADRYVAERSAAGSSTLSRLAGKQRRLERDIGDVRFEYNTTSPDVVRQLIDWKDDQHRRTGRLRIFRHQWPVALLNHLASDSLPGSPGICSALYAGDRLVAAHLGLRSDRVIHMWFPSYDVELRKYSPGLILLLKLLQEAEPHGIRRIDMGPGGESYKQSFRSGELRLGVGAADLRPIFGSVRHGWYRTKRWLRDSRWQRHFDWSMDLSRRLRQRIAFD